MKTIKIIWILLALAIIIPIALYVHEIGTEMSEKLRSSGIAMGRVESYKKIVDEETQGFSGYHASKWRPPFESFHTNDFVYVIYRIPTNSKVRILRGTYKIPETPMSYFSQYMSGKEVGQTDTLKLSDKYDLRILSNPKTFVKLDRDTLKFSNASTVALIRNGRFDISFNMEDVKPTDTLEIALKNFSEGTYFVFRKKQKFDESKFITQKKQPKS